MQDQTLNHKIYQHEPELSKADGVAWVFTNKDSKIEQYPFRFPEIKEDEVRIKIQYTGLCHSDCLHARALWNPNVYYPICPGHEVIGEVTQIGSKVTTFKVGQTAGASPQRDFCGECENCLVDKVNICDKFQGLYDPFFGGYATHIQLPAKMTFQIPEKMPIDVSPPLLCAGMTVFAPILRWRNQKEDEFNRLKAKYGDKLPAQRQLKVGVFGIGGLGHLALQYLNKMGYEVTAFTTSTTREKELKALGAHNISHSTNLESLNSQEVAHQYDMILNTLYIEDKEQFTAIQRTLKKGGTLIQVGLPPLRTTMALDVMNLVFHQISIQGSIVASYDETVEMLEFSAKHEIYPTCEMFDFEDFPKAFDLLENGRPKFRACVNVQDWAKKNGFNK